MHRTAQPLVPLLPSDPGGIGGSQSYKTYPERKDTVFDVILQDVAKGTQGQRIKKYIVVFISKLHTEIFHNLAKTRFINICK